MEISGIRVALAAACTNVVDTTGAKVQALGYQPDSLDPPCVYAGESTGSYDDTLDGLGSATVTMRLIVSRGDDLSGQALLDALLASAGPSSVKAAIEADPTLGGECSDLHVSGWSGYQLYDVAGTEYFGAELTVEVLA